MSIRWSFQYFQVHLPPVYEYRQKIVHCFRVFHKDMIAIDAAAFVCPYA